MCALKSRKESNCCPITRGVLLREHEGCRSGSAGVARGIRRAGNAGNAGGAPHAGNAAGAVYIGGAGDGWGTPKAAGDPGSMLLVRRWKSTAWWENKCASQR